MAFASGHLLAGVIAAHPRHLGRFHALTIEGSCRWLLVTTRSLAHLSPQGIVNALPRAIITKGAKIRVHALPMAGYSRGSIRHWQPVTVRYSSALITARISSVRGLPPGFAGGI